MQRKDYVLIAAAIKEQWSEITKYDVPASNTVPTLAKTVRNLAIAFQADNPRFDANKFIVACGLGELVGA